MLISAVAYVFLNRIKPFVYVARRPSIFDKTLEPNLTGITSFGIVYERGDSFVGLISTIKSRRSFFSFDSGKITSAYVFEKLDGVCLLLFRRRHCEKP